MLNSTLVYRYGRLTPLIDSFRFNDPVDRLIRTTDLFDYNGPYTTMAWVMLLANPATNQTFWAINALGNDIDWFRTATDGVTPSLRVVIGAAATNVNATFALALGKWYHITGVRESATSLKCYIGSFDFPPILAITNTRDVTGRTAPTRFEYSAALPGNNSPADCRISLIKNWSGYAMSREEIVEECYSVLPKRPVSYNFCAGIPSERGQDLSGFNRHFTELGALTFEEGPPLPFRGLQIAWGALRSGNPWHAYAQQ